MTALNNYGVGYNNYGVPQYPYAVPSIGYQSVASQNQLVYVHGIDGANAYQLRPGITEQILWDDEKDTFYIKKLDEMGRPKIVAWKDFFDHVEPEHIESQESVQTVDMSKYLTKDDLLSTLDKLGFSNILTKSDLDRALSELTVGVGGKVVRVNELDK